MLGKPRPGMGALQAAWDKRAKLLEGEFLPGAIKPGMMGKHIETMIGARPVATAGTAGTAEGVSFVSRMGGAFSKLWPILKGFTIMLSVLAIVWRTLANMLGRGANNSERLANSLKWVFAALQTVAEAISFAVGQMARALEFLVDVIIDLSKSLWDVITLDFGGALAHLKETRSDLNYVTDSMGGDLDESMKNFREIWEEYRSGGKGKTTGESFKFSDWAKRSQEKAGTGGVVDVLKSQHKEVMSAWRQHLLNPAIKQAQGGRFGSAFTND